MRAQQHSIESGMKISSFYSRNWRSIILASANFLLLMLVWYSVCLSNALSNGCLNVFYFFVLLVGRAKKASRKANTEKHELGWELYTFAIEPLDGLCKVNYITRMFRLRGKNSSHGSVWYSIVDDEEGKNWLTLKWILFSFFPPPNHFLCRSHLKANDWEVFLFYVIFD